MPYNVAESISAYENGGLDQEAVVTLFQHLVDDGQVWEMNAKYVEKALELAEAGVITLPHFGIDTTYSYGP